MTVGGEVHSDEKAALIDDGSAQAHLWGINLYPGEEGDAWIAFAESSPTWWKAEARG